MYSSLGVQVPPQKVLGPSKPTQAPSQRVLGSIGNVFMNPPHSPYMAFDIPRGTVGRNFCRGTIVP